MAQADDQEARPNQGVYEAAKAWTHQWESVSVIGRPGNVEEYPTDYTRVGPQKQTATKASQLVPVSSAGAASAKALPFNQGFPRYLGTARYAIAHAVESF